MYWNTVVDSRNIYDGLGGDSTFMNYAGGLGFGGYSFQTTPGTGTTPLEKSNSFIRNVKRKKLYY